MLWPLCILRGVHIVHIACWAHCAHCMMCTLHDVHIVHLACALVYFLGYAMQCMAQVCVEVALGHLAFEHSAMCTVQVCILYIV